MEKTDSRNFKAYLMPFPEESFSKPVLIGEDITSIGRDATNTIQIAQKAVSRKHAKILLKEGQYQIVDLDSSNGTIVNNKPIKHTVLNHRDKISIGKRSFVFMMASEESNDLPIDLSTARSGNILLNDDEIDPSELYAQMTETASFELFHPPISEEHIIPDSLLRAHERLGFLYKMSEKFRSFENLDQVLGETLDLLAKAIPAAERSVILLRMGSSEPFEIRAHKYRNQQDKPISFPISRTVVNWVISEGIAMVSQDVKDDRRFDDSKSIKLYELNSIICVPIKVKDIIIGIIYIDSGERFNPLSQGDLAFAAAVANELALLIENYRLNLDNVRNERIAAIGMTITDLAHNIKNLVNINLNAVDLMDVHIEEMNEAKIVKNWSFIRRGFEQINNLAVEMLDYAKDNKIELKSLDINELVLSTKDYIEYDLVHEGIELALDLDPTNPVWMMDENQLQRAIINLVVNSTDAIENKEKGRIQIETAVDENQSLRISVSDNGCGIDSNQQSKIFYLFYTTKGSGGSGLGLPVVKKFIENMGGKLKVESKKNTGTTISMIFPKITD